MSSVDISLKETKNSEMSIPSRLIETLKKNITTVRTCC